jgi:hypothetical protein
MADMNDPLPGAGVSFWTMAAAAVGSLLTLRTLVDSNPVTRIVAVVSSWSLALFATPAVAEYLGASHKQERLVALLIAFLGMNVLAGLATFVEKWRVDPQAAFAWLWSLWKGGRPQ